jgi:hypothetical protein
MTAPRFPADDDRNRARHTTQNRCLTAATATVTGILMLVAARNDAMVTAGAISLAIAVLLGSYAYRHRYQASGGSPPRHLVAPDPRFFRLIAALAVTVAVLTATSLLIR